MASKKKRRWDDKFHLILAVSIVVYFAFGVIVTIVTVPIQKRSATSKIKALSPRFAKLLLKPKKKEIKKKPPPKPKKVEKKKEPKKAEKKKGEKKKVVKKKVKKKKKIVTAKKAIEKIKKKIKKKKAKLKPKASPKIVLPTKQPAVTKKKVEQVAKVVVPKIDPEKLKRRIEKARKIKEVEEAGRVEEARRVKAEQDRKVAMQSGLLKLLTADDDFSESASDDDNEDRIDLSFAGIDQLSTAADVKAEANNEKKEIGTWDLRGEAEDVDRMLKDAMVDELDDLDFGMNDDDALNFNADDDLESMVSGLIGEGGEGAETSLREIHVGDVANPFTIKGFGDGKLPRSPNSLYLVMNQYKERIRKIYNKYLLKDPTLEGIVVIEYQINPDGKVLSCIVTSTTLDQKKLEADLIKNVLTWKFQKIEEDRTVTVEYPIPFKLG